MTPIFYPINAWEKRKFGDLYSKTSEKNDGSFGPDKIISVATMSWKTNVRISSEDYLATYNVLRKGDIAFEGNKSKKFSFGRFVENDIGDGIVSHVFVVFRPKVSPIISYWKYFIHNEFVMRNILRKSTIKATMMTNLSSHDFLRQTLCTPSFKEQENIGNFLERLDSLIAATQGKLDNLEKIKRALLKHLFDQSMRFRGYSDPWEKRKFGELYKPNKERNESAEFSSENTLSIATMTVNRKGNGAAKTSLLKYKVIRIGDIAFEGHTSKKFAFGRFVLNDVADGIMSPRFTCVWAMRSIGLSCLMMPLVTWSVTQLTGKAIASASAVLTTLRTVAGAVGTSVSVALMSFIANRGAAQQTVVASVGGVNATFISMSIIVVLMLIIILKSVKSSKTPEVVVAEDQKH